ALRGRRRARAARAAAGGKRKKQLQFAERGAAHAGAGAAGAPVSAKAGARTRAPRGARASDKPWAKQKQKQSEPALAAAIGGAKEGGEKKAEEEEEAREEQKDGWVPGEPIEVRFEDVSWTPAVNNTMHVPGERRSSSKPVLNGVSWEISGAEKVGLIGANGSGKSSMLLMINDLLQTTSGQVVKRPADMRIGYMKQEADLESSLTAREALLSVFGCRDLESIDADLESVAMEGDIGELDRLVSERTEAELQHQEVEDLIPRLGLSSLASTPIPELSGGWQMRVGLGQIMLRKPQLILLDEPTNHVDLETVEFMEDFLRSQDVPMVIVSHDRYFLNQVCTKIVEIYRGKTATYWGNYVSYLRRRDRLLARDWSRYREWQRAIDIMKKGIRRLEGRYMIEMASKKKLELAELEAKNVPKPEVSEVSNFSFPSVFAPGEGGIRPKQAKKLAPLEEEMVEDSDDSSDEEADDELFEGDFDDEEPDWSQKAEAGGPEPREPPAVVPASPAGSDDFWGGPPPEAAAPRAEAEGAEEAAPAPQQELGEVLLEVRECGVRYSDKVVLDSVSLTVRRGEKVALVGPNGCGKSTLVRAIMGDLGEESFVRGDFTCTDMGMAYFPQRLAEAFNSEKQTVKDVLFMSCKVGDLERAGGIDSVLTSLQLTGITANQPVCSLSGGEKARVAFAQFLLDPCALLVLDEPTNHLDIATRELLEDALKKFDGGALVVSHDRFFLREFATRVVEFQDDGTLREFNSWDAYSRAAPPQWAAATEAEGEFIEQDGVALQIWSKKSMTRVKRRYGNVGLRRLSPRAVEKVPEPHRTRSSHAVERLIAEGVSPGLLGPHADGRR
ncbi:unnamed protein product, partial [Prorocentrum cordatum]